MAEVSDEDREKIAKMKFKEWFNENFDERFGGDFDNRLNECFAASGGQTPTQQPTARMAPSTPQKSNKESLFSSSLRSVLNL